MELEDRFRFFGSFPADLPIPGLLEHREGPLESGHCRVVEAYLTLRP